MEMEKSNVKILVVDDDQRLLALMDETLSSIGYITTNASSASEALLHLSQNNYDLVITDINMPEIDGLELLHKIRENYPKLPVIFITGAFSPDMAFKAKPEGFLTKPFRIANLEDMIEKTVLVRDEKININSRRILVIDDDENFREMLMEALKVCEYDPLSASTPQEALEILQNTSVNAVITDIKMPVMDGVSLASIIKEKYPNLPVVLITAYHSFDKTSYQNQQKVADGILQKPFGLELVLDILEKVIRAHDKSAV